jgi:transposase-like protein
MTRRLIACPVQTRWSEAKAREVLREWVESGMTVCAFARERGLEPGRLYWWRERLGMCAGESPTAVGLVPVVVRSAPPASATVWTRAGNRIEVSVLDEASARWVGVVLACADGGGS